MTTRCDYCSNVVESGSLYYRSVAAYADFYCVNCYNKGKAAPKSDYRPAVRIGGGREFMRLSSSDLEALVAGLALKAEEESVMDPEMPCRRRRSDVEDKD